MKQLHKIFFSPTKTTQKTLEGISEGLSVESVTDIDLTLINNLKQNIKIENGMAIIGVPVYSGRVPQIAADRLKKIRANNTPAILVVVYGNRHFDDALLELKDLALEIGFKPIAASAFIGEHSFSTEELPVAQNRPDEDDLIQERKFGRIIAEKIYAVDSVDELEIISVPGNSPYKERSCLPPISPDTDIEKCEKCEACVKVCPTGAITVNGSIETDIEKCILCAACVKVCPNGGRLFNNDFITGLREKLFANCSSRKEPEFFVN